MNSFALVLLLAAAASAASAPRPAGSGSIRGFPLYGHPAAAAGVRGAVAVSEIPSTELQGWRSVYEKPTFLAVKHEDKPEITAFLAKDGLSGLAESPDTRFLHDMLRFGEEKVGVFLSASKFLPSAEADLPVNGIFFPKGYSLSDLARAKADTGDIPWVLVAPKKDMRATDLAKLALVGDFKVTENGVKVASDIPAPAAAKWASRHASFPTSAHATVAGWRASPNPVFTASADEASFIPITSAGSAKLAIAYPGAPGSVFAAIPAGSAQPGTPVEAVSARPSSAPFGKSATYITLPASRTIGSPAPISVYPIMAERFSSPSPASAFESDDEASITLIPVGSAKYDKYEHAGYGHQGQYAPPCTPYFRAGSAKYDAYFNPASHFHGCAPYVLA